MMKIAKFVLPVIAAGFVASSASAALTSNNNIVNSPAGVVQNNWTIDTDSDFLSGVIYVVLTSGSSHDPTTFLGFAVDGELVAAGNGDTFFTANGNTSTIIAGGAGDLDGSAPAAATVDPQLVGVAWGSPGPDTDDIGNGLPMGRYSFTDDAQGTWSLLFLNEGGDRVITTGEVINGAMVPEPASLALMGLGGLVALRRRR